MVHGNIHNRTIRLHFRFEIHIHRTMVAALLSHFIAPFAMSSLPLLLLHAARPFSLTARLIWILLLSCLYPTVAQNRSATMSMLHSLDLGAVGEPAQAAHLALQNLVQQSYLEERLTKIFSQATSSECRALIGTHVQRFLNAVGAETSLPFADLVLKDECEEPRYDFDNLPEGMHLGHIQNRTYQTDNPEDYIDNPQNLILCYGILTHNDPQATIRLVDVLYQEGYVFVIHVDGKESAEATYQTIVEYASTRDYVHVLAHPHRARVNWGGFSMVNATLQILNYALAAHEFQHREPLFFHKFVHLASTSYPLASNTEIRRRIASFPLDANLMHVIMKPTNPSPSNWHYFVECDDAVHRIYRLHPLTTHQGGIELHTSSQWFILSREFAEYIAKAEPGSFVHSFLKYAEHVVVADETFFGTVLRHTRFCKKHHNSNFLHLQFDRWESDVDSTQRDPRKCMMPSPDHCGRSPTTMTMDYLAVLELSGDLFARKFDDSVDSNIKTVIDEKRDREEERLTSNNETHEEENDIFEGHGVLLVAKETIAPHTLPLCLGLGPTANKVKLVRCFYENVLPTLADGWETGAVVLEETVPHNRWNLGPCSKDGSLERLPSAEMNMTSGTYSPTGPRCMLQQVDGLRSGRCIDGESEKIQPGGEANVFPCVKRWNQFVSVGNGDPAPQGSIHTTVPRHIVRRIVESGREQESYFCLGVLGRGEADEQEGAEDAKKRGNGPGNTPNKSNKQDDGVPPLSEWEDKQLVMASCSNRHAVIHWLFVPFIVEDEDATDRVATEPKEDEL